MMRPAEGFDGMWGPSPIRGEPRSGMGRDHLPLQPAVPSECVQMQAGAAPRHVHGIGCMMRRETLALEAA